MVTSPSKTSLTKTADPNKKRCNGCTNEIADPRYFECRHFYHEACFKCSACKESLENKFVYLTGGFFVCGSCHLGTCSRCCKLLTNDKYLKVGSTLKFHPSCLRCDVCGGQIKEKFFNEKNKYYCPPDYMRLFLQCAACKKFITPFSAEQQEQDAGPIDFEFVSFEGRKYHVSCFTCHECKKPLEETAEGIRQFFSLNGNKCCRICIRKVFTPLE